MMKILWITNMLLPEMQKHLGIKDLPFGGWMTAAAKSLIEVPGVELAVASVSPLVKQLSCFTFGSVTHYAIPYGKGNLKYNHAYERYWKEIENKFSPDVVHIHGTEFTHGLSYVKACGADKVVVSIQGLVSVIAKYCTGGISDKEIWQNFTLRDLLFHTGIRDEKKSYVCRGKLESELIEKVHHIIGRTTWDRAHVWAINPGAKYYAVNESLRDAFYDGQWIYSNCVPHTIFLSQGTSALKGAHWVIKALPLVLAHYPDTKIRIAGKDVISVNGIKAWLKRTNYAQYLRGLAKSLGIEQCIEFLGVLTEEEMKMELLRANVFICPSSIENSPNSLAEAQILGVPCLASYVGGVPDMMIGKENCLYRFEEPEILAYKICSVFDNFIEYSYTNEIASSRHNREKNCKQLFSVYQEIIDCKKHS